MPEVSVMEDTVLGRSGHLVSGLELDAALELAGLDYTVKKYPAFWEDETEQTLDGREYHKAEGSYVLVREDTGQSLGHCGSSYTVTQNREALRQVEPLLEDGRASLEHANVHRGGRQAWISLKFDQAAIEAEVFDKIKKNQGQVQASASMDWFFGDQQIQPFGTIVLDHSGWGSNVIAQLAFRLHCLNQLPAVMNGGRGSAVKIYHRENSQEIFRTEAHRIFHTMGDGYASSIQQAQELRYQPLTIQAMQKLVLDQVWPIPTGEHVRESTQEAARQRRQLVLSYWRGGSGHVGDESAWEALNGAVEAIDRDPEFEPRVGRKPITWIKGKADSDKRKIATNLIRYCRDEEFRYLANRTATTPLLN